MKLIASDLDGTLLDEEKNIRPKTLRYLTMAAEMGVEIVPATGRICTTIPEAVSSLGFINYVIGVNGAEVRNIKTNEVIYQKCMPLSLAQRICDYFNERNLMYYAYVGNLCFLSVRHLDRINAEIEDSSYIRLIKRIAHPVEDIRKYITENGTEVQKLVLILNSREERSRLLTQLVADFPETLITSANMTNIEVNAIGADKGTAMLKLAQHLRISPSETMAFGDGLNDIPMLRDAAIGVAMENADGNVKAAADYVTLSNEEDGVAEAIRKFVVS